MELNNISAISRQVRLLTDVQAVNPPLEAQAPNLAGKVVQFNADATAFNERVDAFKARNAETESLINGYAGLDTAIKVFVFIAVAAIIAFVVLSALTVALPAILLSIILPAAIAGSVLLTTILSVAKAAVDGILYKKATGYQMEYGPLRIKELRLAEEKRMLEELIANDN